MKLCAMKNKPTEKEIVSAVLELFKKSGFKIRITEAQFCERFIDILCADNWKKQVIAIEAKVNAPSRAFEQAVRYKYIADYVYVALFKNGCNKLARQLANETDIGLIFVSKNKLGNYVAKVEIVPSPSGVKDKRLKKYVLDVNSIN